MEYTLSMTFVTDLGKKSSLTISDVKDDLTEEQVLQLMDLIIAKNIFESAKGLFVAKSAAKLTKTDITKYNI